MDERLWALGGNIGAGIKMFASWPACESEVGNYHQRGQSYAGLAPLRRLSINYLFDDHHRGQDCFHILSKKKIFL